MQYCIFVGDYAYSSWSLRGWLLFERFGIGAAVRTVDFAAESVAEQVREAHPSRSVPTCLLGDTVVWDSLAIAEELASRHPDSGHWPASPQARATARSLAAEMHASFGALRRECPMSLRVAYSGFEPSTEVREDVARLETIWNHARTRHGGDGPWLCGEYSVADAFFAPVAARIATYGLEVGDEAQCYVAAHLADLAFRRWRAMAMVHGETLPWYAFDLPQRGWPGPAPAPAEPIESGAGCRNETCPYSGAPVTHFLRYKGQTWGFCNAFCRNKTAVDPTAWPRFMELVINR